MSDEQYQGLVSLVTSLDEDRVAGSLLGERQPMRWRIDWFSTLAILVLIDPLRLTAPNDAAVGWVLFDDAGNPIWLQPLHSLMQAGDSLSLEPGGHPADQYPDFDPSWRP